MKYCCSEMKHADEKGIIDYAPNHLTTIDVGKNCYPIHFCPFCGGEIKGTKKSVKRIEKYFGRKGGKTPTPDGALTRRCGAMRRLKHWRDSRRAKKIMKEIIAKEGPPESEDEVAEIFKRAWEQLGYKVVDDRAEFEERGEADEQMG